MAKMRARRISGSRWVTRSGSRAAGIPPASRPAGRAPAGSPRGEPLGDAEPTIGLGEQHDPAIGTDPSAVKGRGDLLAADGWKAERQKVILGHGGGGGAPIPAKGWLQQPNPTPDQKLTLLPPPLIRPRHEYEGLMQLEEDVTRAEAEE